MACTDVGLLGPINLTVDGFEVDIPRRQVRGLLALLALNARSCVAIDVVVDSLWEQQLPSDPTHAVHVYVNRLRSLHPAIADAVQTTATGYRLDLAPDRIDVFRFTQLVADAAAKTDPEDALRLLDAAIALWRGPVCGSFQYSEFAVNASRRLDEELLETFEARYAVLIQLNRAKEILPSLHEMAHRHPYRDRLVQLLIEALRVDGREMQALHVDRLWRDRLSADHVVAVHP